MLEALRDVQSAGMHECNCGETPCIGSCTATLVENAIEVGEASLAGDALVPDHALTLALPPPTLEHQMLRQLRYVVDLHDRGCHLPNLDDARAVIAQAEGRSPAATSELDTILAELEPD